MFYKGNNPVTDQYWTDADFADLATAATYHELFVIAERILQRMPDNLTQVCGPISTGGLGSIEANLTVFDKTIKELQATGRLVFDQMYFEVPMQRLKADVSRVAEQNLLDDFYLAIFKTGKISTLYFMPNWESSYGAQWEHRTGEELGLTIEYAPVPPITAS